MYMPISVDANGKESLEWFRVFVPARFLHKRPKFYPGTRNGSASASSSSSSSSSNENQRPTQYLMFALEYGKCFKKENNSFALR